MKYKYSSFKLLPCGVHVSSLTAIDDDDDDATQSVVGMMIGIPLDTVCVYVMPMTCRCCICEARVLYAW